MFLGEHRHSIDAKNRLFIPAKFRDELKESFIVAKPLRGKCLRICTKDAWNSYLEPIRKLPRPEAEVALRVLTKDASEVSPDAQGRVNLSGDLVKKAELGKNVVIVGCNDYIEVWAEAEFARLFESYDEEKVYDHLMDLGL